LNRNLFPGLPCPRKKNSRKEKNRLRLLNHRPRDHLFWNLTVRIIRNAVKKIPTGSEPAAGGKETNIDASARSRRKLIFELSALIK